LQTQLDAYLSQERGDGVVGDPVKMVSAWAKREASLMNAVYVGTEHLLLAALFAANASFASFLRDHGIEYEKTRGAVREVLCCGGREG
jgi:hypothetical protein